RDEIHGNRQRRAGHPEVEVARDGEVAGERRILEVPHARRAHAGLGEPIVKPCGSAVAEVGAYHLMNGAEHLKQHEDRAGKRERTGRSEEHTSELQSRSDLVCRLLLEKKKKKKKDKKTRI